MKDSNSKTEEIFYVYHYGDQHGENALRSFRQHRQVIMDGGSNIHIHLLKRLEKDFKIRISTYKDNYQMRFFFGDSKNVKIREFSTLSSLFKKYLLYYEFPLRCIYPGLTFLIKKVNSQYLITYSDFLPEAFAGFCIKLRNPKIKWVASYFLEAPKPWDKESPYKGKRRFIGFFYWLLQRPCYWMIRSKADFILVCSELDVEKFLTKKRDKSKVIVVHGGVDIKESEKYLKGGEVIPIGQRKYDACFLGRFHDQKGVLELIDIWRLVCNQKKDAKLAMIGGGPLENDVKEKIRKYNLEDNIDLLGFRTGKDKYQVFKQSKMILHPATYDIGGMAAAEGMAWGLPSVSFDLEGLKTCYPKGMIKTKCFDLKEFSENILKLLNDEYLYSKYSKEAHSFITEVWDWNKRAEYVLNKIKALS